MQSAIKPIVRALVFYSLSVLTIAAVLAAGAFAVDSVKALRVSSADLKALGALQAGLAQYRQTRATALTARLDGAQRLPLAAVDARMGELRRALHTGPAPGAIDLRSLLRGGPEAYAGRISAHYRAALERELWTQELAYLQQVRAQLVTLQGRADARRERERLHRAHIAIDQRYRQKKRELDQLTYLERKLMERAWTTTPALGGLARDIAALAAEERRAAAACNAQQAALDRVGLPQAVRAFSIDGAALDRTLRPLDELVAGMRDAVSTHPVSRAAEVLLPALPVAAGLLLAAIAGRFAVRAILYFVLAPLVTRRPPMRLDGAGRDHEGGQPGKVAEAIGASAVSQAIRLDADEELLVLADYLQASPAAAVKTTRWLSTRRPWTSLVSGMVLLTCVRTHGRDEEIVLAASGGGLKELALVRLPAGAALVFRPRALVGLVCGRDAPPQVEQRWHLGLHAWLTFQWRYFLIRGPVTLVLQGARGVRVQRADGAHLVRPAATLGFSADVVYSTQRSAPFLPYLRGQAGLLYDRFAGRGGIYLVDASPDAGRRGGRVRRGLEGLSDGVLKLFGL